MQEAASNYNYLKFIPLISFNLWDVKRYYNNANLNFKNVVRLADILIPYHVPVSKAEMIKNKWQIISKINFGGELFLRGFEEINTYKGNVNLVPGNAIIYSKINVRHGCIYYHEKGKTPFGVSSEYPTYTFDGSKINGKFLHKILRSNTFKKLLNTKTTGISKARVKQDEFLNIEIPLPSLEEQERIIDDYNNKVEEAKVLQKQANNLEEEIEKYLFKELGINFVKKQANEKTFQLINFEDTQRWDTLFLLKNIPSITSDYKLIKFSEVIAYFNKDQHGNSIRVDSVKEPNKDFKYIGMENIERETGMLLNMPNVKGIEIKSQTLNVPKNYFIYGKLRPYLNKFWINETEFNNIICSSEFFVFKINENINKLFFRYVLSSKIIQSQIADKTSGARMPRINEAIFCNIKFPLPEFSKQKELAVTIQKMKNQILVYYAEAQQLMNRAETEFEKQIFN